MKAPAGKLLLRYAAHKGTVSTATPPSEEECDDLNDAKRKLASAREAFESAGFTLWFADVWNDQGRDGQKIAELVERNKPSRP